MTEAAPPSQRFDPPAFEPSFPIARLTRRPQFLAAAKAPSAARGAVVIQALDRRDDTPGVRVGFTATRKIGGAVVRNRAKRRLREAARAMIGLYGRPGFDYVLIARAGAPTRPWRRLLDDVKSALLSLHPAPPTLSDRDPAADPHSGQRHPHAE